MGTGSAERVFKIQKLLSRGQRAGLDNERSRKQGLAYARYQEMRYRTRVAKLSVAGVLWNDEDFECCHMTEFCRDTSMETIDNGEGVHVRVFRAWKERWEKKKIGPKGDKVHEARLVRKYGGLQWIDIDNGDPLITAHPEHMWFEKKRGNNEYHVVGCKEDYDYMKKPEDQNYKFDLWGCEDAMYGQITEY